MTPRHARPGPRESRGAGAGRIRGALGGSAPCPHPRHSWNLSPGDQGAFWALRVMPVHLSWRWRCQFLLRWPHRRCGDQTPTGRVVGLPLWTRERPPSPSRSQNAPLPRSRRHRVSAGACGRALPEAALQPRPFFKAGVPDGDLILNVQKRPESESAGLWHPVPWRLWVPTGGGGGSWPSPKPPMGPGIPEELAWGPHGWSAGEPGSCSPAARSSPQARAQPVRRLDK